MAAVPAAPTASVQAAANAAVRGLTMGPAQAQQRGGATTATSAATAGRGIFKNTDGRYVFYSGGDPNHPGSYSAFTGNPGNVAQVARPTGFSHSGFGAAPGAATTAAAPADTGAAAPASDAGDTPIEDSTYYQQYIQALQSAGQANAPLLAQRNVLQSQQGQATYNLDNQNLQNQQIAATLQGRQRLAAGGGFWTGQRNQFEDANGAANAASQNALYNKEGQGAVNSLQVQIDANGNVASPLLTALQTAYGSRLNGISLPSMSGLGVSA